MYTVGIDLGGTNIAIGICDGELNIIDKGSVPTLAEREPIEIIRDMVGLTKCLLERNSIALDSVRGVGIATPGSVDAEGETVEYANNIPFNNFPLAKIFKELLPVPEVKLLNDANAATLGEALAGAARGARSAVMITLGTGVGGGVVFDGKLFTGHANSAGAELGHTVIALGGRQCTCGRRGCFEAYASATALTALTREKMYELELFGIKTLMSEECGQDGRPNARTAFSAMKRGDKYAKEVVDEYIGYLAEGVTNMVNIFQPEVLIIGGGICNERENLTRPLISLVDRLQYTRDNKNKSRIVTATLGNDAGIIGAAGFIMQCK
ncbi:MAG: ROK family protein [Clostridia bacterium]|nr:ROK family protein [Clostridia bacterium]